MASIGPPLVRATEDHQPGEQHITLNGDVFELPDFTMKQIHDAIPAHCFQPSVLRSMAYVVRDFVYFSILVYLAGYIQPSYVASAGARVALWAAYTTLQGMVMTGIWILAHECGHGAFSKHRRLNSVMGLLMHSFLLVPFHSWRITHSAHHKATGNIDKDTAFVPHTRQSWVARNFGPAADVASVHFAHLAEDAPVVTLWNCFVHQFFGWPGYLLFNLTGQKYPDKGFPQISHFWFGQDSVFFKQGQLDLILLSDLGVGAMIAALVAVGMHIGSWNTVLLYVVPWLWVNNWIGKFEIFSCCPALEMVMSIFSRIRFYFPTRFFCPIHVIPLTYDVISIYHSSKALIRDTIGF
jgi:omega-6 fatty acid desaturase / acyl-lipid omega-6 desaturase (Delta-12 desaturase)